MSWNKKYDDTKESLIDKSHKPINKHPKAHTYYMKKEAYEKGYSRYMASLYYLELTKKIIFNNN